MDVVDTNGVVHAGRLLSFNTTGYWPADTFAQWGLESMAQVERDHRQLGSYFYLDNYPNGGIAFAWDMLVQLRGLTYAAQIDRFKYISRLDNTLAALESYWNTAAASGRLAYAAYPAPAPDTDVYTDDNSWLAVPLLRAYRLTTNSFYLARAKNALDFALSLEEPNYGGILWRSAFPPGDTPIMGSSSTTGTAQAAVEYYELTGDTTYLNRALTLLNWLSNPATMTDSDGLIWPSMFTNGMPNKWAKFTYDSAVPLQVYLKLYSLTGNTTYKNKALALAGAIQNRFVDPVTGGIRDDSCFAFTVIEAYVALYQATGDKHWLDVSARALDFVHSSLRDANGRYSATWWEVPYVPMSSVLLIGSGAQPIGFYAAAALGGQAGDAAGGDCFFEYHRHRLEQHAQHATTILRRLGPDQLRPFIKLLGDVA